ncbi:sterol desaturase family protein [Nocardia terpenica]|uniref:Fatty acid hydroxylase domain-containing protein n=1 Tax=Nocardia terpenica TaxID=455432 RepID=A0A6G9Z7K4_9NOCA|nr:sterol desaturase family protein [Nocardia terpenica]QIS21498.1 hypothetical protein F6W96_27340 [Nocardia terpenica]
MTVLIEAAWLIVLAVLEIVAMQWRRLVHGQVRKFRNLAFAVVNHAVIPVVSVSMAHLLTPRIGTHWVAGLPVVVGVAVTVVVLDFAGYWFHRFSHRNLFLWRFHQIHHLDEDFDATTGARVHTIEGFLHHVILLVLVVVLGVPASYFTGFVTLSFLIALFHHANIAIPARTERVLRLVLFTPALHVPHHHEDIANTDTNFGFIFPWWDRMFGTYNTVARTSEWRIGLDYSHDLPLHRLLVQPFLPRQLKETAPAPAAVSAGVGKDAAAC